jgi:hypothetical protein
MLLANRAMSRSRLGRHDEALRDFLAAAELARKRCPQVANGLGIALAVVLSGQGQRAEALRALASVTAAPERLLTRLESPGAQLPLMNM